MIFYDKNIDNMIAAFTNAVESGEYRDTLISEYRITHKPTGTKIWIGNGFFSYGFSSPNIGFPLIQKIKFSRWLYKYLAARIASGEQVFSSI